MRPADGILFEETITRKPPFVYPVVVLITGAAWALVILQAGFGLHIGGTPVPTAVLVIVGLIFGVGLPVVALVSRQRTIVTSDMVRTGLSPFWTFRTPISQVREAKQRRYRPMREYTGWGIRYMPKAGWAINISGNRGVQLVLKSGKRILIASDRTDDLERAIRGAMCDAARDTAA